MKIAADSVTLAASHNAASHNTVRERLRAWIGDKRPDFEAMEKAGSGAAPPAPSLATISEAGRNAAQTAAAAPQSNEAQAIQEAADAVERDPLLGLLRAVVEMLTGHKIRLTTSADLQSAQTAQVQGPDSPPQQAKGTQGPKRAGFGIEYDRREIRDESEQTSFQAEGKVRTADGQEIDFKLTLDMSRQFHEESEVSIRAGDGIRKDPLVINFDGSAAQLQSRRFKFDIDGDGKAEEVPMLSGRRGYLALDLNGNGKIDSGKELFGAASGDGFAELARYDSDGNGWIDASDPVFRKMQVWTPDGEGKNTLSSLADHGVGALSLGKTETPFALKDQSNRTLGAVRASGVYLAENGTAGSLQQIDVMV